MGDIHGFNSPAHRALILRALATSLVLSLLFVIVYGSTNWLTAQRPASQVGAWYYAWELTAIPYVPALIVPYMSMDLFFFLAAFLCRDEKELGVYAKRVVFAIAIAAAFFLLMPLKLNWPQRAPVAGWFGDFVEQSVTAPFLMEYPHNLFPSLHITLCMIVADVYYRHTRGIVRVVLLVWFCLIGLSALLTWQHHVVDIAGGFVLGAFAFYLFGPLTLIPSPPEYRWRGGECCYPLVNLRVGFYYATVAAICLAIIPLVWPWGVFVLWPVGGLGMVAGAYFGLGAGIFCKRVGRLPLSARFVLAPVLVGHYLSLRYYQQRGRAWNEVTSGVMIGRTLTNAEAATLIKQEGVTAVLDLTAEFTEAAPFLGLQYRNLPILDLTAPTQAQLHEAVDFITEEAAQGRVYVHCKIGYSRSAAVVGAFLLASHEVDTAEEAAAHLRAVRPGIIIRAEAFGALAGYAQNVEESCALAGGCHG